jgi:hypothetical protein
MFPGGQQQISNSQYDSNGFKVWHQWIDPE